MESCNCLKYGWSFCKTSKNCYTAGEGCFILDTAVDKHNSSINNLTTVEPHAVTAKKLLTIINIIVYSDSRQVGSSLLRHQSTQFERTDNSRGSVPVSPLLSEQSTAETLFNGGASAICFTFMVFWVRETDYDSIRWYA